MKPVVVFDGVCGLCSATVDFIMKRDPRGRFLFAANQSDAGRALLAERGIESAEVSTIYLVEDGRVSSKSTAALRIARGLRFPWFLAYVLILIPRFLRDAVYDWVA